MNVRSSFIRSALTTGLLATLLVGTTPFGSAVAAPAPASPFATPPASPAVTPSPTSSRISTVTSPSTAQLSTSDLTPSPAQAPISSPGFSSTPPAPPPSAAVSNAPTEDIRDIRGPKTVFPAWLLPVLLAVAVLLAFGVYAAWRRQRRRRRPRALLPFEVALQRLEEIRPLMQPATAREFSTAASDIVRRYIEQRFDVTATHQTTEEFLRDLLELAKPSLARHRGLLSEFLHQCDLVKFAALSLSTHSMESLHQSARAFVLETAKPDAATQIGQPLSLSAQEAHDSLPST